MGILTIAGIKLYLPFTSKSIFLKRSLSTNSIVGVAALTLTHSEYSILLLTNASVRVVTALNIKLPARFIVTLFDALIVATCIYGSGIVGIGLGRGIEYIIETPRGFVMFCLIFCIIIFPIGKFPSIFSFVSVTVTKRPLSIILFVTESLIVVMGVLL